MAATATRPPGPQSAPRRVLVLGGSGFIGRRAVEALLARGCEVTVGSRRPRRIDARLPEDARACPRRTTRLETLTEPEAWDELLAGVDSVLNCVGILRQRGGETYRRVHHLAVAALADACRRRGVRLVHVSALGLEHPVRSRFLRSKRDGEAALRASGADWRIARPSLLDGNGGYGARWIRRVARWPVQLLPADATGRIAALDVDELGEALANLVHLPLAADAPADEREFDLGGPALQTLPDYLAAIRRLHTDAPLRCVRVPGLLARLGSHVCDLLHWTPFSFGHWELLRNDNRPARNRLPELLGRVPKTIGILAAPAPGGIVAAAR
jgi:uncharacterized protein YbjT (DUF2867 family)